MLDQPEIPLYAADRLVLASVALLAEALVGRLAWLFRLVPHPAALLYRATAALGSRLDRRERGRRALLVRGAIVTLFVCALAGGAGVLIAAAMAPYPYGWTADIALVALLVTQRGAYGDAARTMRTLTRDGLAAARDRVAALHGGIVSGLDDHGVCRALAEHLARSFGRRVVGPVFWYLLLGLPGLLTYAAILAGAEALAHDAAQRAGFGWTALRLEAAASWLPGRIAGVLMAVAAVFAPTARPFRAFRIMAAQGRRLGPAGFGWPAAALAGALSLEIAGPNAIDGRPSPWVGEGTARATARDARRALLLFAYACVLHGAVLATLAALRLSDWSFAT